LTEPKLVISLGGAHQARITEVKTLTWSEYVNLLTRHVPETEDKASRGWSIPAKFDPVYRDSDNLVERYALTFDYDHIDDLDLATIRAAYKDVAHLEYTTWSHTEESPRYRFVLPLKRPVTYDEFQAVSRMVASWAGIELTSRETHVPAQMMYLPTCKPGGVFKCDTRGDNWLDPDLILNAAYVDWTNRDEWPKRKEGDGVQHAGKAEDPRTKPGIIGAFCRAFDIYQAIERFELPYVVTGTEDRLTYTKGSRPEGAIVYDDATKLHSHHDTDPARGQTNAFDLVRLHRFSELDRNVAADVSITERPSFKAMVALAAEQPEVSEAVAADDFADLGELTTEEVAAVVEEQKNEPVRILLTPGRPVESALDKLLEALRTHGPSMGLVVYGNRLVWALECHHRRGFGESEVTTLELRHITGSELPAIWHGRIAFVTRGQGEDGSPGKPRRVDCPTGLANAAVTRTDLLTNIAVDRVASTPIFKDGNLYANHGYAANFRAWVLAPDGVAIHSTTKKAAEEALAHITQLLAEFPFDTALDKDVALAALLTAAMRASLPHAPGFVVSKPDYGSGASTLCDLINVVLTGRPAPVINASVGRAELEKNIDSAQLAGLSSLVIDNVVDGETFNSIALAQVLSQPTRQIRILGRSEVINAPCMQMVLVNGNNIRIGDDLVRRFVRIHLDPRCESPHRRAFKQPNLIADAVANRAAILSDLYTIVAAYQLQSAVAVAPIAGFEAWSQLVAAPLVWLGRQSPIASQKKIESEDDKRGGLRGVMDAWAKLFGDTPVTAHEVLSDDLDQENQTRDDLKEFLQELCGETRGGTGIGHKKLAKWLRGVVGRVVNGMAFEEVDAVAGSLKRWRLRGAKAEWLT